MAADVGAPSVAAVAAVTPVAPVTPVDPVDPVATAVAGSQPSGANKAVASNQPLGAAGPEMFKEAEVLKATEMLQTDGRIKRVAVVKADFKYPLVRVEEVLEDGLDKAAGKVVSRTAMVADHILIRLKPGMTEDALTALHAKHGTATRKKMLLPNTYLVSLPRHDPAAVPEAIAAFGQETRSVANAMAAGASAAIIYNNAAGNFLGTLGVVSNWIPAVSISMEDGQALLAKGNVPATVINMAGGADISATKAWDLCTGSC